MLSFDPAVLSCILKARRNDPSHVISLNDATKIDNTVARRLDAPDGDPAAIDAALQFASYDVPTRVAQDKIAQANERINAAMPVVQIGDNAGPYATLEGRVLDITSRQMATRTVRISQAVLDQASQALDAHARTYVEEMLRAGGDISEEEIIAEQDLVSQQLRIEFVDATEGSLVRFEGTTEGSDWLPPTAFSVSMDKRTGSISGLDASD